MSYLLKALEKAQKERETASEDKIEYAQHRKPTSMPRWLISCILLILAITLLQIFGLFDWLKDESQEMAKPVRSTEKSAIVSHQESGIQDKQKEQVLSAQVDKIYTLMELTPEQITLLPSIELQSHIYSPRSEMRSVIINDQNYKEGDLLSANVGLKEITQKGIVLKVGKIKLYLDKGITWVAK